MRRSHGGGGKEGDFTRLTRQRSMCKMCATVIELMLRTLCWWYSRAVVLKLRLVKDKAEAEPSRQTTTPTPKPPRRE